MNRIKLCVAALCVSLGLLAMPVAMADTSGKATLSVEEQSKLKADLFATFDRTNRSERKQQFEALLPEQKQKVLTYYKAGKETIPDNEKGFIIGTLNLMQAYKNIPSNIEFVEHYKKTGKFIQPKGLLSFSNKAASAFQGAEKYVELDTFNTISSNVTKIAEDEMSQLDKETAQLNKKTAQLNKKTAELNKVSAMLDEMSRLLDRINK